MTDNIFLDIGFEIFAIGLVLLLMFVSKKYKNHYQYFMTITRNLLVYVFFPGLIFVIILLGAVQEKYPVENPQLENVTTYQIFGDTTERTFEIFTMKMYNIGKSYPDIFLGLIPLAILTGIYLSFSGLKEEVESEKNAQEIIDSINEEDYKDLEDYEKGKKKSIFTNNKIFKPRLL